MAAMRPATSTIRPIAQFELLPRFCHGVCFRQKRTSILKIGMAILVATCRLAVGPHLGTEDWRLNGDKGSGAQRTMKLTISAERAFGQDRHLCPAILRIRFLAPSCNPAGNSLKVPLIAVKPEQDCTARPTGRPNRVASRLLPVHDQCGQFD